VRFFTHSVRSAGMVFFLPRSNVPLNAGPRSDPRAA
jgi:hypothetical protein